jgi:coenzyme F420-reducing hydrogenase beta subunit
MMEMICEKNRCYGCDACHDVCPAHAIAMEADAEGFYYPRIDASLCRECGMCKSVCPADEEPAKVQPRAYLFRCNETALLEKSSSGGAFSLLADHVLTDGGYVAGAAFSDAFNVCHIVGTDISGMRKSKYIQSDVTGVYEKILELLRSGVPVLFSGTPCQCHAMLKYCEGFQDKLYTLAVICRGVSSPGLWKEYIKWLEEKGSLEAFCFRDKRTNNNGHTVSMTIDGNEKACPMDAEPFSVMFIKCLTLRPSCYSCQYTSSDLPFDFTIGDFFNAGTIDMECADGRGASVVLVRSKKGQALLEKCRDAAKVLEIPIESADQPALKNPAPLSPLRRMLFRDFAKTRNGEMDLQTLLKKYGGLKES